MVRYRIHPLLSLLFQSLSARWKIHKTLLTTKPLLIFVQTTNAMLFFGRCPCSQHAPCYCFGYILNLRKKFLHNLNGLAFGCPQPTKKDAP